MKIESITIYGFRCFDDMGEARVLTQDSLPSPIAFDHGNILADYFSNSWLSHLS